jgi:hypothetical protein
MSITVFKKYNFTEDCFYSSFGDKKILIHVFFIEFFRIAHASEFHIITKEQILFLSKKHGFSNSGKYMRSLRLFLKEKNIFVEFYVLRNKGHQVIMY